MEPNENELMHAMTPSLASIPPIDPGVRNKLVELLDSIIAANAGRPFVIMALNVARVIIMGLPTATPTTTV